MPTPTSVGSSHAVSGSGPARGRRRSAGPINVGHEGLACASSTVFCATFCALVCWSARLCWCDVWTCRTVRGCRSVTIYVRVRSRGCAAPRVAPTRAARGQVLTFTQHLILREVNTWAESGVHMPCEHLLREVFTRCSRGVHMVFTWQGSP